MIDVVKPALLSSITISPHKSSTLPTNGSNFADFFKTDIKEFLHKAHEVEGMMTNYVGGIGDIEEIAPKFKELMLDFEVKTKIISSLANILKTLTSMNI